MISPKKVINGKNADDNDDDDDYDDNDDDDELLLWYGWQTKGF